MQPVLVGLEEMLLERRRVSEIITVQAQIDIPNRSYFISTERHTKVTADFLAERF